MKYVFIFLIFFSIQKGFAQIDSASQTVTVQFPVKGIVLYGFKLSVSSNWADRKAPDALLPLIGSGTQPDSVINVTVKAGTLSDFLGWLITQSYGAANAPVRSILSNSPAIAGYTALTSQIVAKANGNTAEKAAATYVVSRYNAYQQELTNQYNTAYAAGLAWIRN